ncbi:HAMP domain-containing histidine kinase [Pectobacterium aroidearum]|uniref:histidine kinase n=1 Tax=Pectobacterium aroidearum TaxID=1201031 RepID=A0ABR5Z9B1_9GAMM|nr:MULTISPECIES: HAMP domain-containing sensor histidine kinase [Pectobacterium]MBA5198329.1 HAMP domain-containing histidine kinase [Pectobacterium aroidearum]MBA5227167.1 HAMP domain-containing histidine kinase [Pectobacterium aroidearum]MBA5231122.1 HAMP domain-containing histidine kinase [Pectobacterium aroidearum]MBA5736268.1 HAMP domain-containing histidine kinase [Pectobacterium aroidearum]UUE47008.1 HAMP domain-containing histidine kinase [Pectobacterium aroidearum]
MKSIYQQVTLKTRIMVSFVLLMVAVMAFVVVADQLDYDELRAYVISENLRNEVQPRLEADITKGITPIMPEGNLLYDAQSAPDVLRQYALGYHRMEKPAGWHLLVFELNDRRYYLLQDGKDYEYLEYMIDGFAPLVILLCILCAFWIGRLTSARVTVPITRLADVVQRKQKPFPFQDSSDEIGVLARAFAQHSDELERFLQRERCFVSDASHELRTPLAIIGGAAETIVHQLPTGSHLMPSAERIVRTTQEMQRQLTCLLLLSRDPQTLPLADVPLRPLFEECITRCQPWLAKKPVALTLDVPQNVHVHTNAELARSVVWNLLRNACQYTDEGEVRIALHGTTLIISDTGPGLPPSIDPQQFQRFLPSSRESGEGLGLSIVQRIVEHLGWNMTVESSEKGCRFTLEMRCAA